MLVSTKKYPEETRESVEKCLSALAELQGMPILCLFHDQEDDEGLDNRCLGQVRGIISELAPHRKVSVLINSPGGDIEDAFRIVRTIRHHVDYMEVLVPYWAKSAATFFCLGANKIYMGPDGELGPLDPQLSNPRGSLRRQSALQTFKALEYLRQYSSETLGGLVRYYTDAFEMDIPYAVEQAQPLVSAMIKPLFEQVDPEHLGDSRRWLSMGEEYARRVMKWWSYADKELDEIVAIVDKLVWDYPTHGFVITLEEAQSIGLNAVPLEEEADNHCKTILIEAKGFTGAYIPEESAPQIETDGTGTLNEDEGEYDDQDVAAVKAEQTDGPNGSR